MIVLFALGGSMYHKNLKRNISFIADRPSVGSEEIAMTSSKWRDSSGTVLNTKFPGGV